MKTGTKFIIRDTAQCMGKHTGKQFVYPTQKHSRDTHSERKCMDILSNEGECSKSETRQRHTPRVEWGGVLSEEEHSKSETRQKCTPGWKCRHPERGGVQ